MLRGKLVAQILVFGKKEKIVIIASVHYAPDTILETLYTY